MTKKLGMAVVGLTSTGIGNVYVHNIINNHYAELKAVCDISEEKVRERAEFYHLDDSMVYTDYKELLKHEGIDAVCVITSDQAHKEIAIAAMRAGKDVLCEKPMALKADDCREMIAVAKETGKRLMVGQICRFTPSFILAKQLVDSGEIGDLVFVESEYAHKYSNTGTGWRESDPDRNVVIGGGCHAVDLLRWFAGNPIEVYACANTKINDNWPYADTTIATMKFENDVIGKVFVSGGCTRSYTMRTCLYGTEGTIIVDNTSPTLSLFKKKYEGQEKFCGIRAHEIEIKLPVQINNHNVPAEVEHFVNACLGIEEIKIGAVEGCNTVIACAAIVESSNTGEKVKPEYVK